MLQEFAEFFVPNLNFKLNRKAAKILESTSYSVASNLELESLIQTVGLVGFLLSAELAA